MTVYVDQIRLYGVVTGRAARYGRLWCHMGCDGDLEELHRMAARIGLKRSYFQNRMPYPHYDLIPSKRTQALLLGAVAIDSREWIQKCRKK